MATLLQVRPLAPDEEKIVHRLAHSRTEALRLVQRAQIIEHSAQGLLVSEIVNAVNISQNCVRKWIKRFNAKGIAGLQDEPRSGRPATYSPAQVSTVIEVALTKPETLGLPFACWTLDRLAAYLNEQRGIAMKRSRIDELLIQEGLRWRLQETWFTERVDPDFAEKRGLSSRSIRHHLKVVS